MKNQYFISFIAILLALNFQISNAQAPWNINGNNISDGQWIGTINPRNFDIWTNGFFRMRIDSSTGYVGIANTPFIPAFKLDVRDGDININTGTKGFRIDSNYVLWHNNLTSNIFVGVNAGNSTMTGIGNTFIGYKAGYSDTTGYENTFVGAEAGFNNDDNYRNTFIGYYSGQSSSGNRNTFTGHASGAFNSGSDNVFLGFNVGTFNSGSFNTFIGNASGSDTASGSSNTYVGYRTAQHNSSGSENTFLGRDAGRDNIIGSKNTFLGNKAGEANKGGNNTYIGYNARGTDTLTNAAAIGYNASVTTDNSMVLGGTGSAQVNVGIGVTAPAYTLDVNGTIAAKKILIVNEDGTQDLLAMITQLRNEVNELKAQFSAMAVQSQTIPLD